MMKINPDFEFDNLPDENKGGLGYADCFIKHPDNIGVRESKITSVVYNWRGIDGWQLVREDGGTVSLQTEMMRLLISELSSEGDYCIPINYHDTLTLSELTLRIALDIPPTEDIPDDSTMNNIWNFGSDG